MHPRAMDLIPTSGAPKHAPRGRDAQRSVALNARGQVERKVQQLPGMVQAHNESTGSRAPCPLSVRVAAGQNEGEDSVYYAVQRKIAASKQHISMDKLQEFVDDEVIKRALTQLPRSEVHRGKTQEFVSVVCDTTSNHSHFKTKDAPNKTSQAKRCFLKWPKFLCRSR